jgi:hypothetical protein
LVERVLRGTLGPKRDEVTGEWRKLHNEELNNLYSSPNRVWVIKSRRLKRAGHAAHRGRAEVYTGLWWGKPEGKRDHLEDPGIEGRIVLRWIFRKWNVRAWAGSMLLRIGTGWGGLLNVVMNLQVP